MEKQTTKPHNYSRGLANLFCRFFKQYKFPVCIVYGNPDTGKSDTACLLAEIGLAEGVLQCFASNMSTYGRGEKITSLEDVNYWFQHQSGTKLFLLDEAGIADDTRSPLCGLTRKIRHSVFVVRKFQGHWVFILQDVKDLDTWKDIAKIRCKWEEDLITVRDFPRTSLPFDTLDIAEFALDRQITDAEVNLKGTSAKVALLYIKTGRFSDVAKTMGQETQTRWENTQVKRELIKFIKQALRIKDDVEVTNDNA